MSTALASRVRNTGIAVGLTHYDHRKFISANLIGTLIWGIGDDPERLFQRFARADDGTAHQGYGLGLALARDVVSRYHGWIDVESSSSQGTTMRITLPVV
ncbi:ATP-binding protein [Bifidobacterium tissieri]|uniref:histidine kinase n=2 Tax=Bifidobacterium tissieri TaxID=1630162 RepID=A0A5M9ZUC6_9BIFI|nr:ATP-binding protein [Bifidobacterium tissieri]KAA8830903.1 ATP-binding protein [Bifidobacterium tissieri]